MIFRFPWVRSNQRIIPKDFVRLASSVEDLVGNIARHMFEDPDSAATSGGVVLWGLAVTDASDGVAKVRVAPGAALLPTSAGDRAWRLCILSNAETISLSQAVGPNRVDTIQLELLAEPALDDSSGGGLEESEQREFRVVVAGVDTAATSATPTFRQPAGNVTKVEGGDGSTSAGAVALAKVTVGGVVVVAISDIRHAAWPDPSSSSSSIFRGAGVAYRALRLHVNLAILKMATVIDSTGGGMVSDAAASAGGPTFGPDAFSPAVGPVQSVWLFNARGVVVNAALRAAGLRPIPAWLEVDATPHATTATHYENDADGLKINAALVTRAIVSVRHYPVAGGVAAHLEWIGQNVTSVSRTGVGVYVVTLNGAAFGITRGDWWSDRWIVRHYAGVYHSDTPALSWPNTSITAVFRDDEAGGVAYRLTVNVFVSDSATPKDAPFVVELLGPLGATLYDAGDNEPGGAGASWVSVND